jgi:soluble lytic murein transglycosylase-like protein
VSSTNPPADGDIKTQSAIGNRRHRICALIVGLVLTVLSSNATYAQPAASVQDWRTEYFYPSSYPIAVQSDEGSLSPYWGPDIQQWGDYISALSDVYGFHPDFIAAVIMHESDFTDSAANGRGTNGLMDILPAASTHHNKPSGEIAAIPANNLRWGMAILSASTR